MTDQIDKAVDSVTSAASDVKDALTLGFARWKGKSQMQRAVQASFCMSYADGSSDKEEKQKTVQILKIKLPQFEVSDMLDEWDKWETQVDAIGFDLVKGDLLKSIGKADAEEGDFLVNLTLAVADADGNTDKDEKAMAKHDLCPLWGFSPDKFRVLR